MHRLLLTGCAAAALVTPVLAHAQETNEDLAKKLSNPVAKLISVPLQLNYDAGPSVDPAARYTLDIQPVIPVALGKDWNLIIRTILPVIYQNHSSAGGSAQGLGDVTQSFFFSPTPGPSGLVWAIGPAFLWPTGEAELASKKWGAGPTALVLKQQGGTTYGLLVNHIWSYADLGHNERPDVSTTFLQPFLSWTSPTATTVGINAESSYDWTHRQWTIPINLSLSHLYKFGPQRVSLGGGLKVYAARPGRGPDWGLRFTGTFLFPE